MSETPVDRVRAPENVRLVDRDGREIPVECLYAGRDDDGIHVWVAVAPHEAAIGVGMGLQVDVWPPETAIELGFLIPSGASDE